MSCEATPAHANEPFEWHSAERNNPVNCFARGRQHSALCREKQSSELFFERETRDPRFSGAEVAENCFIALSENRKIYGMKTG